MMSLGYVFLGGVIGIALGIWLTEVSTRRKLSTVGNALDAGYFQNLLMVRLAETLFYRFPEETFEAVVRGTKYRVFRRGEDIVFEAV